MKRSALDWKELRAEVDNALGPGGRLRAESRGALVTRLEEVRSSGLSYSAIARGLGLKFQTVMSWRQLERKRPKGGEFARVRVSPGRPARVPATLVVHGPCGLRLEGVTVEQVAELIRSLG